MNVILNKRDLSDVISSTHTPEELKQKLKVSEKILDFAYKELQLPDNGSYRHYLDLGRQYVVWNVVAAPEFSLEPEKWCYIFLGCMSYRGYFKEASANTYARKLEDQGLDVYVGGVSAYSTLGWFKDPVFNTMLNREDWELARLIFHELAHQIVYVTDDTDFNEAFADTVSRIGLQRWLLSQTAEIRQPVETVIKHEDEFIEIVLQYRDELVNLYGSTTDKKILKNKKQMIINALRASLQFEINKWGSKSSYQSWLHGNINNARLAMVSTYRRMVPEFMAIYEKSDGNLGNFYNKIIELSNCTSEQRRQYFDGHIPDSGFCLK